VLVDNSLDAFGDFAGWYRQNQETSVIGVTGSVGKTTTREMTHAALSAGFTGTRSPKNFNNYIGVPLSLLTIERDHEFAVFELGASQQGEIRDLAKMTSPEIGVVTAIGLSHAEGFGNIENITKAKGELVEQLPKSGLAVLAGDDKRVRQLADRADCRVLFVGQEDNNDLKATNITSERNRLTFRVDGQDYGINVTGKHHLTAALCAIAVAREMGMASGLIADGLRTFSAAPGRCFHEQIGLWTVIDDSYNANPPSMNAACNVLQEWNTSGKKILIAGEMLELGDHADACHRELGELVAGSEIDYLLVLGPHADQVVSGAADVGMPWHRLAACQSFDNLSSVLECWLEPGNVVLVKGSRAMRMERVIDHLRQLSKDNIENNKSRQETRAVA